MFSRRFQGFVALCVCILARRAFAEVDAPPRLLLVKRLRRRLPGSKGGGSSKKKQTAVNCQGSWGSWGTCGSTSKQTRTYVVTRAAANGGSGCSKSDGATEQRSCVQDIDCIGSFGPYGSCSQSGQKTKVYEITTAKSGTGTSCSHSDGDTDTAACTYVPPDHSVNWQYIAGSSDRYNVTEMPMVHCSPNQVVEIKWSAVSNMKHDVYQMASEDAYVKCSFAGAVRKHSSAPSGSFSFTCGSSIGTSYFACSVGEACQLGKQKLRIHVTNPSRTSTLRSQNVTTLAQYMEESIDPYYGGKVLSEAVASSLVTKLEGIIDNSPTSCSDWIPPLDLSNETCLAYAYTDIGYISRQRAVVDYSMAKDYYGRALAVVPNFCLAESYLVELFIKEGVKSKADIDAQFEAACSACGNAHLDMEILRNEYDKREWAFPANSACKRQASTAPSPSLKEYGSAIPDSATRSSDWKSASTLSSLLSVYLLSFVGRNTIVVP